MEDNIVAAALVERANYVIPPAAEKHILEEGMDARDFHGIRRRILDFLEKEVGVELRSGAGVNQYDYTDVQIFKGRKKLHVYVNGSSPIFVVATAELAAACFRNGVSFTLFHLGGDGEYIPQGFCV